MDSITHVPIVVPPLPDQGAMHVAGSYGDLAGHATCPQELEMLPSLCLVSALPELVGTGSGVRVALRNPSFVMQTMQKRIKDTIAMLATSVAAETLANYGHPLEGRSLTAPDAMRKPLLVYWAKIAVLGRRLL